MLITNRTIWSDNGTLIDISNEVATVNADTKVIPIVAAQDALYIGSELPFNHRHISVKTANANTCTISVSLWDGKAWKPVADLQDYTSVGGKTLAQSGHIIWTPDPEESWSYSDTNRGSEQVTGLTGIKIYGLYWAKLTFSADISIGTEIKYIGHKFSEDSDLVIQYPDFSRAALKNQFAASKLNWEEQHILAAEDIIRDMKDKNIIKSANQILDYRLFTKAAVHKVAEIVYNAMGNDYIELRRTAAEYYKQAMSMKVFNVDTNNNASLEKGEIHNGWISR